MQGIVVSAGTVKVAVGRDVSVNVDVAEAVLVNVGDGVLVAGRLLAVADEVGDACAVGDPVADEVGEADFSAAVRVSLTDALTVSAKFGVIEGVVVAVGWTVSVSVGAAATAMVG